MQYFIVKKLNLKFVCEDFKEIGYNYIVGESESKEVDHERHTQRRTRGNSRTGKR